MRRRVIFHQTAGMNAKFSLLAARIRRGIIQVLGGRIPEMVVQALPDDVVFTSPTIAQLASFVYGVGSSAVTDKPDTPFKNVPASILDNKDNTIVRLREPAAGEPPLILVHGGCVAGSRLKC